MFSRCFEALREALPDGIFCGSSSIAHGVIRALWESGLPRENWPRLVAVGNGAEDQDKAAVPSLSVVTLPMEQMAGECLRLLLDLMAGEAAPPESRMLEVHYIPRESCGPFRPEAGTEG